MSIRIFEIAYKYSNFLRLCWLGALLHDIGKLGIHFILSKEPNSPVRDIHGQILFRDRDKFSKTLFENLASPIEEFCDVPCGFERFSLLYFICSHHGCLRCLGETHCRSNTIAKHRLSLMLQTADRIDTSNPPDRNKQSLLYIKGSDFFCREFELEPHYFVYYRKRIYKGLEWFFTCNKIEFPQKIEVIERILANNLSRGLSETRKWAHDIDIYSHARSVAVYLRIILLNFLAKDGDNSEALEDIKFKMLKVFCNGSGQRKKAVNMIQHELCLGAVIYTTLKEVLFIVTAFLEKEIIEDIIKYPFELSDVCDISHNLEVFEDIFCPDLPLIDNTISLDLRKCFRFLETCNVLEPEDIEPEYTMERLQENILMVLDYSEYCDLLELMEKRDSLLVHMGNIEKAIKRNVSIKRNEVYENVQSRLSNLEEKIKKIAPLENFQKQWGWKSRSEATKAVWNFLSLALSPIRPPSPYALSRRWKKICTKEKISEECARFLILRKHMNLSRFFALNNTIKKIFLSLEKRKGREITDLSLRQESPSTREVFRKSPYRYLERFFNFT